MPDDTKLTSASVSAMIMYSMSSASMLLINKLCLKALPLPGLVSTAQFIFSAVAIMLIKVSGVAPVDDFEWKKVRPYLLYVLQFVVGIYTNMKALQHSNIDTVIVFRASCPLAVCVLEWAFLGRQLPNCRSCLALLCILLGVLGYVSADKSFVVGGIHAYTWVIAYTLVTATQMAYGKYIVGPDMKFASMWGPTQYTNVLSIAPMLAIAMLSHEHDNLLKLSAPEHELWTPRTIAYLLASCVVGLAISFTGWYCRSQVTATCYTVLGVANKMVTVLVNLLIWDEHAGLAGILWLTLCIAGATGYQQAPLRQEEVAKQRLLNESLECPELLNDEGGEGADSSSESPEAERSPGTELKSRV